MTAVLYTLAAALTLLLCLATFVQMLYMESLRLRARDLPALEYFKQTLEERLGLKTELGALSFSLWKHGSMVMLGILMLSITWRGPTPAWRGLIEALGLSSALVIAAGYVAPQTLYRKTEAHWLLPFTPLLRFLALLVRPLTSLLAFVQSLVDLGEEETVAEEPTSSAEHIDALITAGQEEGLIEEGDRKLIQSVVAFGDKRVREVMTPRPRIVAISADKSLEDLRELVINEQYSRIPITEGSIDQIIGFVHVRDMFELDYNERPQRKVREMMRPIPLVPETKPVSELLREMQRDGSHMVVVVDEYGNTAGLATMEDLVEEVFGEIRDEHEPTLDVLKEPDGAFVVSGSYDLDHLHELLEFRPQGETESTTVGGLAMEWMGRVPRPGEAVEREGIRIEVLAGDELRVDRVRISRARESRQHV